MAEKRFLEAPLVRQADGELKNNYFHTGNDDLIQKCYHFFIQR